MMASEFTSSFRDCLESKPFVPFVVELRDGSNFVVEEPEAIALGDGQGAYVSPDGEINLFEYHGVREVHPVEDGG